MTPTGILFSYVIGAIFFVGGLVFLIGLDNNRLLFGVPYLVLGILILVGAWAGHKRLVRRAVEEAKLAAAQGSPAAGAEEPNGG